MVAGTGCGGAPRPAEPTHDHFRSIQRHEARIAEGQAAVRRETARETPDCAVACGAAKEVCDAAHRLCQVSEGVDDADAAARCERAREACRAVRARTKERCSCTGGTGR